MTFDLQVFNQQTYTTMTEVADQDVAKFNEASNGTIALFNKPFAGDFDISTAFHNVAGLVRRRNAYGSGTVESVRLKELLNIAVKVAAGTAPTEWEAQQYNWTLRNPELAAIQLGTQLAKGRMADMLNTGISAAVAAISGNAAMVQDGASAAPTFNVLNQGAAKMGDRSGSLKAWVLHSSTMHALFSNALSNVERLFTYDGVNVVRDPFGRVFVITDSPALFNSNVYHTLGLVENAILVNDNNDFNAVMVNETGSENIKTVYQAEWTFGVAVKGYSWDQSKGGKSPNDTAIATPTSWKKAATSNKDTAGVLIKTA
ncbi:major capsid protein [Kingella negevensis]|uniref:major capsid protein n=1 Tax=Kingella negevensis TaxID=1522312 RepID=UPI00050A169E|nr:major capsid protein [Kingella negevensis]MDK4689704.1 major capsid protein [Kingella negevensis]